MIVFGASGHGKVIIEILESNGVTGIEVWDDAPKPSVWRYPVLNPFHNDADLSKLCVISIGVNSTRMRVAARLGEKLSFGKAVHTDAFISSRAIVGEGTVIMAGVTINADAVIGKHSIINTGAVVDHDCVVGDYAHVSPNATLCGDVHLGEGTNFGAGATAIQGIRIGKWCTIGAGAVVICDIPDFATAVGCPARVIKINEQKL